jgi:L-prolyl-PCP dehydrogenase
MDFDLDKDDQLMVESIIKFAQKEFGKGTVELDRDSVFDKNRWKKCAEVGIQGLSMPAEYGGTPLNCLQAILAMEALGYGCTDNGLIFALNAQLWSVQTAILRFGNQVQKKAYLPNLIAGELIAAHGMTEPGTGSDSFALSTTANRTNDGYVLNGSKTFISNAPVANLFLIFATIGKAMGFMGITAFLVKKGTPGLTVSPAIDKMGLRTAPLGEIFLDDCVVCEDSRLGREGNGATIFNHSMSWERTCIMASTVGTMQRQLERCIEYASTRKQFGNPIGEFRPVTDKLINMKMRLETARLLLYKIGWSKSHGNDSQDQAAMLKLYISESFVQSSLDAIQIHGAYGYTTEFEIERDLRDSIASRIYSGTSEMQKEIIARSMGF